MEKTVPVPEKKEARMVEVAMVEAMPKSKVQMEANPTRGLGLRRHSQGEEGKEHRNEDQTPQNRSYHTVSLLSGLQNR